MSFSTLIFVAGFLPVFLLAYSLCPGTFGKNIVLMFASIVFYAFAGLSALLVALLSAGVACAGGYAIEAGRRRTGRYGAGSGGMASMAVSIGILLLFLFFFKYSAFFLRLLSPAISALRGLFRTGIGMEEEAGGIAAGLPESPLPALALPLGMSFYIFKLISYLADIGRGRLRARNFFYVLLYALLFHQVAQGPIVRYGDMEDALQERAQDLSGFTEGMSRFVIGLAKKTLLADHAGELAEAFLPLSFLSSGQNVTVLGAWLGMLFFMLQLYLDFSAYSDMALGLGRICGFTYLENFNYPFIADSVRDFWRRWHISLSSFFRDYVYIPLGGSRAGAFRMVLNLLAVWMLTGIWHGSSWNYLFWGLYFFAFTLLENLFARLFRVDTPVSSPLGRAAQAACAHCYTLIALVFSFVLFRFPDLASIRETVGIMLGAEGVAFSDQAASLLFRNNLFFFLCCLVAATPAVRHLAERLQSSARHQEVFAGRRREGAGSGYFDENALDAYDGAGDASGGSSGSAGAQAGLESHQRVLRRIQKRKRQRYRQAALWEAGAAIAQILCILALLLLSIMAMVGNSYMPFMYNQF